MIAAEVPCGELTTIRRNSGAIVEACASIRKDEPFHTADRLDYANGDNLLMVTAPTPAGSAAAILDTLRKIRRAGNLDPVWDCQVLAAVNKNSPLSRRELNSLLRDEFNPRGKSIGKNPFRVGDKIICLRNSLLPFEDSDDDTDNDTMCDDRGRIYVANGELARVEQVFHKYFVARLDSPTRVVRVPLGANSGDNGNGCDFDLGYCITVHRAQGSEWPVAIYVSDEYRGARFVTSKQSIYTAISRAKRACILIGNLSTIHSDCRRDVISLRKTFLKEGIEHAIRTEDAASVE
jgi:exodeoxyribonuclease V alpha subunit